MSYHRYRCINEDCHNIHWTYKEEADEYYCSYCGNLLEEVEISANDIDDY